MSATLPQPLMRPNTVPAINDESHVKNELASLCNHEVELLENRWLQIGQYQRPPKRLIENVNALSTSYQSSELRLKDSVVDEVKLLFKNIRRALRVISIVKEDSRSTPYGYEGLARKATVFIKRLYHDDDLAQSIGGAKRFLKHQKSVKLQQKLLKPVCETKEYDLGLDWHVRKLVCEQELLSAGRKLQLCVNERKGSAKKYFKNLVKQRSTFWLMSFQDEPTYLLELRKRRRNREHPLSSGMFEVREFDGHDHDEPKLPRLVAQKLSQCLRVNPASSEVLMSAGVFPAFETGIKDSYEPDVIVEIGDFTYEAWLTQQDIIVSRYLCSEGSDSDSQVWGYFRNEGAPRSRRHPQMRRVLHAYELDCEVDSTSPNAEYPWQARLGSDIDEDELNTVLIHYLCKISNQN